MEKMKWEKNMRVVNKWFWVWNMEEEKKFLEDMAKEGYILTRVGFGKYYFNETEKQDLIYQADFKGLNTRISEGEYLQMYEDSGWELASNFGGWYYFCRSANDAIDLSIFNDNESKAGVYKRLIIFLALTGFPLYYQNLVVLPTVGSLYLESFHGFFRIIMLVMMVLHLGVSIKILTMYLKFRNEIKE